MLLFQHLIILCLIISFKILLNILAFWYTQSYTRKDRFLKLLLYPRSLPSTVMMEIRGSFKKKNGGFSQLIFSWSLDDILNEQLYKFQVEEIPLTFLSVEHYLSSFVYPLLEETLCG
ncbi:hypothetical protein L6452_13735 [Arctium lappa]|uniref:Uncharacterized protein n=1 Tax=Arctium lappa TaxID=4217 RepID=A0ACB9CJB8_ARCLA|nr:hypothetical protein L6452_13735 [Arctium lappa]